MAILVKDNNVCFVHAIVIDTTTQFIWYTPETRATDLNFRNMSFFCGDDAIFIRIEYLALFIRKRKKEMFVNLKLNEISHKRETILKQELCNS